MECTEMEDEQEALERETRAKWESFRPSYNAWASQVGDPLSEFDRIIEGQIRHTRVKYQKERVAGELDLSSVRWNQITAQEVASLQELLDSNPDEQAMQSFLERNPKFLVQILGGGHGRYQIPRFQSKPRLGSEYIPDFLISDVNSMGIHWYAVELESPRKRAYRKDGVQHSYLTQAISQITDWREWLRNNIDYARRKEEEDGLGLIGIDERLPGLILIGRRDEYPVRSKKYRRDTRANMQIAIHSYDWLLDEAGKKSSGGLTRELPI
ncbi:MAG: DUF4263 domain-containing protein [Chloroflexi bacterium]|nr:DUF4263 domain-containing protein [Chloroflexota bacterium]